MKKRISMQLMCLILLFAVMGCSSSDNNPVTPSNSDAEINLPVSQVDETQTNRALLGMWTINFNLEAMTAEAEQYRNLDMHYNITQMIPPPDILINSYDPVSGIVDVDFTISNPYSFSGYDLRLIIFTDAVGHRLINSDDWTGLFDASGGMPINPFMAFAKEETNRAFAGETEHTEKLFIFLPSGNPIVTFAIDASYPGNCEEPYEISDFMQDTLYSEPGYDAQLQVTVKDWQNDANAVELYCPEIIGPASEPFSQVDTETWEMTIENSEAASAGEYTAYILAKSANSGTLTLYDEAIIAVSQSGNVPLNPEITASYLLHTCLDIAIKGDYAFVANDDLGLKVIDVSDPTSPVIVGGVDTDGNAKGITIDGDYAYLADGVAGLKIIDISSPTEPVIVGSVDTYARNVSVEGNYAYVAGGSSYGNMAIIDVSIPFDPYLVSIYYDSIYDVVVRNNLAFLATYGYQNELNLTIVDVSNPFYPVEFGGINVGWNIRVKSISVEGNFAYLASSRYLYIVDINIPTDPVEVSNLEIDTSPENSSYAEDIIVEDDYAYVADPDTGIIIVNVSNPSAPAVIGTLPTTAAHGIALAGYAYIADGYSGLKIANITDPANPVVIKNMGTLRTALDVNIQNDYTFIAAGLDGIIIIDTLTPSLPVWWSQLNFGAFVNATDIVGNYAYVTTIDGLVVIDISNLSSPQISGEIETSGYACDVAIQDNYAYIADGDEGLKIIDITNPADLTEIGDFSTFGYAYGVVANGDYIYIADYTEGVMVIDVSDPIVPEFVDRFNTDGLAFDVKIIGDLAYIADGSNGLVILDKTDPFELALVGSIETNDWAYDVTIDGNFAYVADYWSGLTTVDISDPADPSLLSSIDTYDTARAVTVSDNYAYVADDAGGLVIVKLWD